MFVKEYFLIFLVKLDTRWVFFCASICAGPSADLALWGPFSLSYANSSKLNMREVWLMLLHAGLERGDVATNLLGSGLDLLIYGMGTVYAFLGILVVCTTLMSRFIERFLPEATPLPPSTPKKPNSASRIDPATLAIIQNAIHQHRAKIQ